MRFLQPLEQFPRSPPWLSLEPFAQQLRHLRQWVGTTPATRSFCQAVGCPRSRAEPPCRRQRRRPFIAGDRHGLPLRVHAPQRGQACANGSVVCQSGRRSYGFLHPSSRCGRETADAECRCRRDGPRRGADLRHPIEPWHVAVWDIPWRGRHPGLTQALRDRKTTFCRNRRLRIVPRADLSVIVSLDIAASGSSNLRTNWSARRVWMFRNGCGGWDLTNTRRPSARTR